MTSKKKEYFSGGIRKSPSDRGRGDGDPKPTFKRPPPPDQGAYRMGRLKFGAMMDEPFEPSPFDTPEQRQTKELRCTPFDPFDDCA